MSPVSSLLKSVHRHHQTFRSTLSSKRSRCRQASVEGGTDGAAILTPTTVVRSRSHPGPRARTHTRLTWGALNAAPERGHFTFDPGGRMILFDFEFQEEQFKLISIYAPVKKSSDGKLYSQQLDRDDSHDQQSLDESQGEWDDGRCPNNLVHILKTSPCFQATGTNLVIAMSYAAAHAIE
ncbi:hypothetical protein MRX96_043142 [Rhipicephalus microplus]